MSDHEVAELRARLNETAKQYEGKLATLSVFNDALQRENTQLRHELEECRAPQSATDQEVLELKQEFTRRMATADKDIARLKEKNEQLRHKLNAVNSGGHSTQARLRDREEYITSLQTEGEALSRKNGELEAALRKMRAAAKEHEAERERLQARLKQQDELLSREGERHERAAETAARQVASLQSEYEQLQQTAQEQINAALQEAASAANVAAEQAERGAESALQAALDREAALEATLTDLRSQYEAAEQSWSHREESLRREVVSLESRVHQQEAATTEAVSSASQGTRPLLRQIESMAAAAKAQDRACAEAEGNLLQQLREAVDARQAAVESAHSLQVRLQQAERGASATHKAFAAATHSLAELQQELGAEKRKAGSLQSRLRQVESRCAAAASALDEERAKHEAARQELQERVWDAQEEVHRLSNKLEKQQQHFVQRSPGGQTGTAPEPAALPVSTSSRLLPSLTQQPVRAAGDVATETFSMAGSSGTRGVGEELEHLFTSETADAAGQQAAVGRPGGSKLAALLLQQRLAAAEASTERANEELLQACKRAEAAQADARKYRETLEEMRGLRARHDMALELLGERNERVEVLEDDIREMKHIFHTQLSNLVDELNTLKGKRQAQ